MLTYSLYTSAVMSVLSWFLFLLFLSLVLRYYLAPILLKHATQIRVSYISLFSALEIEYRPRGQEASSVPTLRVERAGWTWGGFTDDDVGMVVLRLEGITFHVNEATKKKKQHTSDPPAKVRPLVHCVPSIN